MFLNLGLASVFSWIDSDYAFGARTAQKWCVLLTVSYEAHWCLIAGEADLSDLVKVVSAGFLPWKANVFLFLMYRCLGERVCNYAHMLFLLKLLPTNFSILPYILPQWLLCVLMRSSLSFLLHLLIRVICTMAVGIVAIGNRFLVLWCGLWSFVFIRIISLRDSIAKSNNLSGFTVTW